MRWYSKPYCDLDQWRPWFAWRPVRTEYDVWAWVWLEWVERRVVPFRRVYRLPMTDAAYLDALRILQGANHKMLSRDALHQRDVSDATIDTAIARGDVCDGSSILLSKGGERFLAGLPT
jgi:hypothetical protein